MLLLTMLQGLRWTVRVSRWTWVYTFLPNNVSWQDPFNGMHGNGTWRIEKDKLVTRWFASKTREEWDVPINPDAATGKCYMQEGTFDLQAVAQNYYLEPGDVVYTGRPIIRGNGTVASVIYSDEVRSGGTVAWICRNPGNFRPLPGEKHGAYKGKQLNVKVAGPYAIFPDETTGLMAIVGLLRGFGRVTINGAMQLYAPKSDGNDPDAYARILAAGMGLREDTSLTTMSDEQLLRMATLMTGVEQTQKGMAWARGDANMPAEIRGRLRPAP